MQKLVVVAIRALEVALVLIEVLDGVHQAQEVLVARKDLLDLVLALALALKV